VSAGVGTAARRPPRSRGGSATGLRASVLLVLAVALGVTFLPAGTGLGLMIAVVALLAAGLALALSFLAIAVAALAVFLPSVVETLRKPR
jgi:hypothetical protein